MDPSGREVILVVDDAVDYLTGLAILLEHNGFEAVTAESGKEALRKLQHVVPDLIVTDLMMPGMDGLELCRRIRAEQRLATVPILLVSAVTQQIPQEGCFDILLVKRGFGDLVDDAGSWRSAPSVGAPAQQ